MKEGKEDSRYVYVPIEFAPGEWRTQVSTRGEMLLALHVRLFSIYGTEVILAFNAPCRDTYDIQNAAS